ncbi:carbohydrate ABC transporter substrate-binding protein [Oribacterium sp. oral taxon 102]|uniref:ABC transporter substrate-binding protein n=1 Tax=Oribacterium sp. oral taxon 102 TaxID=671214 RepID=UPI0015B9CA43|nr:ABC transporter substrate-binding protein [Oribacterium sp. oral taxon 102]NWO21551.1 carbohydrate ABC transporter substrate-binding protein [Oribacterium sp. oral taxon 102]
MKRKMLSVVLGGAMLASMTACSASPSAPAASSAAAETPAAAENVAETTASVDTASEDENTLSVYAWDANFNIPALKAAEADYKKNVNPDFKLDIVQVSQSSDVENAVTLAGSAGDYGTLPDIVLFQDHYFQKYVTDFPDAWQSFEGADIDWSDFGAEKLSYSTIDGKHYGMPVDNGTVIFAYRTDLLAEAGYKLEDMKGISWDEWIEIGKAVYEKTGKYLLSMDGDGNDLPYMMLQAEGESQFKDGQPNLVHNEKFMKLIDVIKRAVDAKALYLANSWSDYTDQTIKGDMVAGVMNGNWIIPTIEQVKENSGKWEITSMPTLEGKGREGFASNGGSSLYITSNCKKLALAQDFLGKTFGAGSVETYDAALKDGGVITCSISAGKSDVYQQGVEFFNNTPVYAEIVAMGANVPVVEQSDYHYPCRTQVATAIQNIINGGDETAAIQDAEDQVKFAMQG